MAEFCKDCFRNKILTSEENQIIKDEQIVMFEEQGFCEGCGEVKELVNYVEDLPLMKEYIEREVAISELECLPDQGELDYLGVFDCVRSVPAADVELVRHGKWIPRHDYSYGGFDDFKCSICGVYDVITRNPQRLGNYCPNCGAKMDRGKE